MDKKYHASVIINENEQNPLSDIVLGYLVNQKKESPYLDFKWTIHTGKDSDFPEIAKDIFAFANYGGGWLLIGWKETTKNIYSPEGVPDDYNVEAAVLQEKFNSFLENPIELSYHEFTKSINGKNKRFAALFVPPSNEVLKPKKDGSYIRNNELKVVFKTGDIYYRRGTQSIHPSLYEMKLIEQRIERENYRISILSGDPDPIDETLLSNLFEVTKLPEFVYYGDKKNLDNASIKSLLKQQGVFPEFYFKFREWNNKLVTFENLEDPSNAYTVLVDSDTIKVERVSDWMQNLDQKNIIIDLLNRELKHHAISSGLFYSKEHDKFFYSTKEQKRRESWKAKYRQSQKDVAARIYASQIGRYVFCHPAFYTSFILIGDKFYLKIVPTFIITEDGRNSLSGSVVGTIITRLSYGRYNSSYLNNILFWVQKLGSGSKIKIKDYLEIDHNPSDTNLGYGVIFDLPSSEFKLDISEESDNTEGGDYD